MHEVCILDFRTDQVSQLLMISGGRRHLRLCQPGWCAGQVQLGRMVLGALRKVTAYQSGNIGRGVVLSSRHLPESAGASHLLGCDLRSLRL